MVEIESYCKEKLNKIVEKEWNDKWVSMILEDISGLSCTFEKCWFSFVKRKFNYVGHILAKFATNICKETTWRNSFPVWLMSAAREDSMSSCSKICT